MAITRNPDFPAEVAQLVASFSRMADGHDMIHVVEAAANMLSASIHNFGRAAGLSRDETMTLAKTVLQGTLNSVSMNIDRVPTQTDIPVQSQ